MSEWIKCEDELPQTKSSIKVLAKFKDGHIEEVYFCFKPPQWWYVDLKGRKPVIQEEIVEWKSV